MGKGKSLYKQAVLTNRKEFARLFDQGSRKSQKNLQIIALPGKLDESRFAICVSVRFGKSVQRNRLKRILRAAVLETLPDLKKGWVLAVLPRGNVQFFTFEDAKDQFRALCHQMDLIRDEGHA